MTEHQGQHANRTGLWLENDIASRLISHGYTESKMPLNIPYFIRHASGRFCSLYGLPLKVDFYVWHPEKYPEGLIIESKHQGRNGSVDEKFPYLIANMILSKVPAILILLCPAAKPAALRWCLDQQDGDQLRVFTSWEGFIQTCNRGLL